MSVTDGGALRHAYGGEYAPISGYLMSALRGGFNRWAQHLLISLDQEVSAWNGRPGLGLRRVRRPSCGSAGEAVNA
jgi:hypothetical protein